MTHFIPTRLDAQMTNLIALPAFGVQRPVVCSEPLVETTVIDSPHGVLVPLVNWSAGPATPLRVTLAFAPPAGAKPRLAGGGTVTAGADGRSFTFDLEVADALVFDKRGP